MARWNLDSYGRVNIDLLNLEQLRALKKSKPMQPLVSINGTLELAKDADEDTRAGFTAYGERINIIRG